MGLILLVNLAGGLDRLNLSARSMLDRGAVNDLDHWQVWVSYNVNLFEPLAEGAKIGIGRSEKAKRGLVLTKTKAGMTVSKSAYLREEGAGIVLLLNDETARDLGLQRNASQSLTFLNIQSNAGNLEALYLRDSTRLRAEGYLTFLSDIGFQTR